jgi:hypothetical protein
MQPAFSLSHLGTSSFSQEGLEGRVVASIFLRIARCMCGKRRNVPKLARRLAGNFSNVLLADQPAGCSSHFLMTMKSNAARQTYCRKLSEGQRSLDTARTESTITNLGTLSPDVLRMEGYEVNVTRVSTMIDPGSNTDSDDLEGTIREYLGKSASSVIYGTETEAKRVRETCQQWCSARSVQGQVSALRELLRTAGPKGYNIDDDERLEVHPGSASKMLWNRFGRGYDMGK